MIIINFPSLPPIILIENKYTEIRRERKIKNTFIAKSPIEKLML